MSKKKQNKMPVKQFKQVLEHEIVSPFIKSMCKDIITSMKISNALYLVFHTQSIINKKIANLEFKDTLKETILYDGYFGKLYKSSLFLLGATDYIGSIVLMRSLFELLVGIASESNGAMKEKIDKIIFFSDVEKTETKKFWKHLCSWAHPYGKWIKNVCPIANPTRAYSSYLFKETLKISDNLLDFMLVVIVEILNINPNDFKINEYPITITSELPMFSGRIKQNLL